MTKDFDIDVGSDSLAARRRSMKERWQFSLRNMLLVMAIVAVCLGFARHIPRVMFMLVILGLFQAIALCIADGLIHSKDRRTRASLASAPWILFGMCLGWLGCDEMSSALKIKASTSSHSFMLGVLLVTAGLSCWFIAWRRCRQFNR